MTQFFYSVLNVSITASVVALAVMLLRLLLKGAPRWLSCLLWVLVALRLLFPVGIESTFSMMPDLSQVQRDAFVSVSQDNAVYKQPVTQNTQNQSQSAVLNNYAEPLALKAARTASVVWASGVGLMLLYAGLSCVFMKLRLRDSVVLRDNIRQSDKVNSPFVFGVFKPSIYLPFRLEKRTSKYVIAHEKAHIKRLDHVWKPLGFLLLSVHWFNPLMWLAYSMLCKDIEVACDEKVIKEFSLNQRKDYARALLVCKMPRKAKLAYPVAFGEVGVTERIKKTLRYKKASSALVAVAVVMISAASLGLLTDPVSDVQTQLSASNARVTSGYEKPAEQHKEVSAEPSVELPAETSAEEITEPYDESYEEYEDYYYNDYEEDYSSEVRYVETEFIRLYRQIDPLVIESDESTPIKLYPASDSDFTYRDNLTASVMSGEPITVFPEPDFSMEDSALDNKSHKVQSAFVVP